MLAGRLRTAVAMTVTLLVTASPALAAGLSMTQATRAATIAARAAAKQTHAASFRLMSCKRVSSRKVVCHAEARYNAGAKRCAFDVTVTQAGAKARPRTAVSNYACF